MSGVLLIRYTARAEGDLLAIADYLGTKRGAHFAKAYVGRIRTRIETLQQNPTRFRERGELGEGRRVISSGPFLIFYRVIETIVMVDRVLHSAREMNVELLDEK